MAWPSLFQHFGRFVVTGVDIGWWRIIVRVRIVHVCVIVRVAHVYVCVVYVGVGVIIIL